MDEGQKPKALSRVSFEFRCHLQVQLNQLDSTGFAKICKGHKVCKLADDRIILCIKGAKRNGHPGKFIFLHSRPIIARNLQKNADFCIFFAEFL